MPKLIVLRGNSGSGKTTAAKALQEKFGPNTMLISHDMVRMQMLHVWGREGVLRSLPLLVELLRYGRQHSEVTILEGILPAGDYGPLFEAALEAYGRTSSPTITTSPSRRPWRATAPSPTATTSGRRRCAAGGGRKTCSPCSGRPCSQKRWAWRRRWRPSTAR